MLHATSSTTDARFEPSLLELNGILRRGEHCLAGLWVWSPQGEVAMHLPERWGMLQFASGPVNATPPQYNIQWTVRAVAAAVYYAQHAWRDVGTANNARHVIHHV